MIAARAGAQLKEQGMLKLAHPTPITMGCDLVWSEET